MASTRDNAFFPRSRSVDKAPCVLWNLYLPGVDRNRVSSERTHALFAYTQLKSADAKATCSRNEKMIINLPGSFVFTCKQSRADGARTTWPNAR